MTAVTIEDDVSWGIKLEMILENMNIDVVGVAKNVNQAIDLLNTHTPNIILADVVLDDELVFEVFESNEKFCAIPTLFLTSSEEEQCFDAAKKVKNHFYAVKPLHPLTVQNIVDALLNN
jgi:DNA-binding response OmpR family regulator